MRTALFVAFLMAADSAWPQERTPAPGRRWDLGLTALYEYDTNPLRYAAGAGDTRLRLLPAFSFSAPAGGRTSLWLRSSFRTDRYGATPVLNGVGWNAALGLTRALGVRGRVYFSYNFTRSDQPDVLEGSPLRFASYTQHGVSLGAGWDASRTNSFRANVYSARRTYRGLVSSGISGQVDPVSGLGVGWTHRVGRSALSLSGQALRHQSDNPLYRYTMPFVALDLGRTVGGQGRLGLSASQAWLRYSDRPVVGAPGTMRRDNISEVKVFFEWNRRSSVTPFVQVSRQWDRSTEPLRTFTDSRILAGVRLSLRGGASTPFVADSDSTSMNAPRTSFEERTRDEAARRVRLAYDYLTQKRWDEAAEESQEAARLDPDNAHAWANLGIALFKKGDLAAARTALERSLSVDPANNALRLLLARPELQR